MRAGGCSSSSASNSSSSSPKLDKSQLSLPIRKQRASETKSPEKQLSCPLCSYTDHDSDTLQTHVNNQHLDKISPAPDTPHACPICGDNFSNVTLLQSHVNTVHSDIVGSSSSSPSVSSLSCPD